MSSRHIRVSLRRTQELVPDHDYPSTADNMHHLGVDEDDACWSLEAVPVKQIDPFQLHDDPDDIDGLKKIASIIETLQRGEGLPPVFVVHRPAAEHPYYLVEGKHRFNALHRDSRLEAVTWVAHDGCCGSARD